MTLVAGEPHEQVCFGPCCMRLKSVRKLKNSGVIAVNYIRSEKNLVDPFTKGLARTTISVANMDMGLRPI